jgi:ferredoxin-NADP reductase
VLLKQTERTLIICDVLQAPQEVRVYRFLHGLEPFEFLPGQFVVARTESRPDDRASLTLCSSPSDPEGFEVMVKRTGNFGTHFYDTADIGSRVHLTRPTGPFGLPADGTEPICFLSHDYTVPAARSLLLWLKASGSRRRVVLLHEIADAQDSVFRDDFENAGPDCQWLPVPPGGIGEDLLRQRLGDLGAWLFFIQAEGGECKRLHATVCGMGVDPKRVMKERWS